MSILRKQLIYVGEGPTQWKLPFIINYNFLNNGQPNAPNAVECRGYAPGFNVIRGWPGDTLGRYHIIMILLLGALTT